MRKRFDDKYACSMPEKKAEPINEATNNIRYIWSPI